MVASSRQPTFESDLPAKIPELCTEWTRERPDVPAVHPAPSIHRNLVNWNEGLGPTTTRRDNCMCCRPDSFASVFWSLLLVALMIYDLIRAPLKVLGPQYSSGAVWLDFSVVAFWNISMFMNSFMGFYVEGLTEMRPRVIAWRYARTWWCLI